MRTTILGVAITTLFLGGCGRDSPLAPSSAVPRDALLGSQSSAAGSGPVISYIREGPSGLPFYADLARGFFVVDGEWAGIAFYHPTSCIRPDFNLLDWIDFAGVGCPTTITAKFWWRDPNTDPFPYQEQYDGLGAVPFYFVRWSELAAAIADDNLEIGELNALPSLIVGFATDYHVQVLNTSQGQRHANSTVVASGTLEDGRSFQFHYHEVLSRETDEHSFTDVKIAFK